MKNVLCLFIALISLYVPLHAEVSHIESQGEVAKVDLLIKANEENLQKLKALRQSLVEFKKAELEAMKNPNDTKNLLTLVNSAKSVQDLINQNYLQDYFAPQFLEELRKFAQVADKKTIPPAK